MSSRQSARTNPHQQSIKKSIMSRVRVLYAIFAFVAVAIFGMIIVTQYGPNGTPLRNRSDLKCYKMLDVPASRGNIYAHDGRILVTDSPSYDISLDFTVLDMSAEEFNRAANALADSLSRTIPQYSKNYFVNRLHAIRNKALRGGPGSQNQRLIREKVNQIQLDRIKTFPIFNKGRLGGGLIYTQDAERYKPFGTLAARTLGKPGEFGLEASFNDVLSGHDGQNLCVRLVRDVWVPVVSKENVESVNGKDLVTTIDVNMQDIVETELRRQILDKQATCGTAVIMDVKTGEIRAISNLTRYGNIVRDDINHAITMRCEPGSTFKLVSLMALLEKSGFELTDSIDCSSTGRYYYEVGRRRFLIADDHKVGKTTIQGMFEQSSNIGFVKMIDSAFHDKPERFTDFVNSLHIDQPINMQLTGGLKPIIKDPRRPKETAWDAISLIKMAYGYAVEITPMHTLMLYNAIANDGCMVAPRLVTAVTEDGHVEEQFDVVTINDKLCSSRTLRLVRQALEGVVENGTGSLMKNPNYKVAGKTGTAQVAMQNRGYSDARGGRDYLATFVGYFPADKPRYTCIVAIKTYYGPGSRHTFYGASLAGPAFKAIADRVYALEADWHAPLTETEDPAIASVKGGDLYEIRTAASRLSVRTDANWLAEGWGRTQKDSTGIEVLPLEPQEDVMPAVTGMSLKDALYLLESRGLRVQFSGRGKVVGQSIRAGSHITEGATVSLTLRP